MQLVAMVSKNSLPREVHHHRRLQRLSDLQSRTWSTKGSALWDRAKDAILVIRRAYQWRSASRPRLVFAEQLDH